MKFDYAVFEELCIAAGKAPSTAAEEAGIARNQPGKWKKGSAEPGKVSIKKLADYFGVSPSLFLVQENGPVSISADYSVVMQNNSGNNSVTNSAATAPLNDMEREILRIFRSMDMRQKSNFMVHIFNLEEKMKNPSVDDIIHDASTRASKLPNNSRPKEISPEK